MLQEITVQGASLNLLGIFVSTSYFRFLVLGGFGFFATHASAGSFEEACARQLPPTVIEVVPLYQEVATDYNVSYRNLTQIQLQGNVSHAGTRVLGITQAKMSSSARYGLTSLSQGTQGCARPRLHITLSFAPIRVFVGREFVPGTCEFQLIFDHEVRHVKADNDHLAFVAQKLQQELTQYFGNTVYYGNSQQLQQSWQDAVQQYWMPRAQAWMKLVENRHAQIDTPAEYARNNTACGGAVPRIIQQTEGR